MEIQWIFWGKKCMRTFIFWRCIISWLCKRLDGMQIRRNQSWDGFPRYLLACGRNQLCKCLFNLAVGVQGGLPFLFEATWVQAVCLNCRMQHLKRAVRDKMPDIWVTSRPSGSYYAKKMKKKEKPFKEVFSTLPLGAGEFQTWAVFWPRWGWLCVEVSTAELSRPSRCGWMCDCVTDTDSGEKKHPFSNLDVDPCFTRQSGEHVNHK